ncbi:MAG: anti-sigma factor family protein [bacterium]
MKSCRDFESLLSLFAGNELEVEQSAQIVAHLERCAACRQKVSAYKQLASHLSEMDSPALPDKLFEGFYEGVVDKIAASSKAQSRWLGLVAIMHAYFRRRRLAFAVAALFIMIIVPILLTQRFRTPSQSRTALMQLLEERNWPGLYSAILDRETGGRLLNEPVPVELLRAALIELVQAQSQDRFVRAGLARILAKVKTRGGTPLGLGRSAQILGKVTVNGFELATRKNRIVWNPEASLQILLRSNAGQTMTIQELLLQTTQKGKRL